MHPRKRAGILARMATRLSDPERELRRLRDDAGYRKWQDLADTMREDGIEISRSTVWRYCVKPGPQLLARNVRAIARYLGADPDHVQDLMEQLHTVRAPAPHRPTRRRKDIGGYLSSDLDQYEPLTPPPANSPIRVLSAA